MPDPDEVPDDELFADIRALAEAHREGDEDTVAEIADKYRRE